MNNNQKFILILLAIVISIAIGIIFNVNKAKAIDNNFLVINREQ